MESLQEAFQKATLKSNAIEHLIDAKYKPTNKGLDELQRAWLFKVMQDNFKQSSCKVVILAHEDTQGYESYLA
jgi:hypothetical protein